METKNLTIICITIIAIVLIVVGTIVFTSIQKEDSKIKVSSNSTLYEDGSLTVKLTDLNKAPIVNERVNLTITDENGKVKVKNTIATNSKCIAKYKLGMKKGQYDVLVIFEGNKNYNPSNATQKLTIKERVKKTVSSEPTYQKYSPQYGTYVNEYTDSKGIQHIDGGNGMKVSYDPSTGIETYDDGHGHVDGVLMG